MILKGRTESDELLVMRSLNTRMDLTEKDKFHYLNLEKGYEGEVKFDQLSECLQEERYVINDLLLEVNKSYFQIDKLIISQGPIHLLDIKNYEGDYYLESEKLFSKKTKWECKNPVDQLKRCGTLFQQLLQNLKLNHLIETSAIFVNPEFTLYQAPTDLPIIFPSQVNRYLSELNKTPSKLNDGHKKLAQTLLSLHQTKNPHTVLPEYNYEKMQNGSFCKKCNSFMVSINNYDLICGKCGAHERIEQAIVRNVKEFMLLFPERKITTQGIYEWCQLDLNTRTISRVLQKNFTACGRCSSTFYK
jgi:DNA-directed RNA polymerase subunit M/transcription elongation factor TFIIS